MNALGLGAFDSSGATDWFTLSLSVPENTKTVSFDVGVSNVVDDLYDSEVIVDQVGDQDCQNCGDCTTCPTDPMCQPSCSTPQYQSCSFYLNCAEAMLECGPAGYPQEFGDKNCNKFSNNIDWFSSNGQSFVWNTMLCLQQAMVPVLEPCTATCDSFNTAAFNSHPGCYVQGGFCGLSCADVIATVATVGTDIFKGNALAQVAGTAAGCAQDLLTTLGGCAGEALILGGTTVLGVPEAGIVIDTAVEWINQLL
jgi:hypothetical protein